MTVEKFHVEASHIMMFARAIGDDNKIYYDSDYATATESRAIIAPPTFVQSSAQFDPEYRLRPKIDGRGWIGSGKEASSAAPKAPSEKLSTGSAEGIAQKETSRGGGLHAEQRFIYTRHPRVGDVLTAFTKPGGTWTKEGRRSGKLIFSESITEYRDRSGEVVVTAIATGVRTERPVDPE